MPSPIPYKYTPISTRPFQQQMYTDYTDYGELCFHEPVSCGTVSPTSRRQRQRTITKPIPVRTAPAYHPIYTEYTDYGEIAFSDPVNYDSTTPSKMSKATTRHQTVTAAKPIPTCASEPVYEDYTDYGETCLSEPGKCSCDYDSAATLDGMLRLERVPNHRRDSEYETPFSPVQKLQREEVLADEAIPAIWAQEQEVQRRNSVKNGSERRRRSSLLLAPPLCTEEESDDGMDVTGTANMPHTPDHDDAWPLWMEAGQCAACKAALKWKFIVEEHAPRSECLCEGSPSTGREEEVEEGCLWRGRGVGEDGMVCGGAFELASWSLIGLVTVLQGVWETRRVLSMGLWVIVCVWRYSAPWEVGSLEASICI